MSRVSIERRMERLRETVLPPGSLEWRIDRLSDDLARRYQSWCERCAEINSQQKKLGLNSYEMMIGGYHITPPMPIDIERALWPEGRKKYVISTDMTVEQAADIYQKCLEGS